VKPNFYFYRMTTDNGGAPCVHRGIWSLAICKPRIRKGATEGDLVIGFAGNYIDRGNGVIHIAKVTTKLEPCVYYETAEYEGRPDRIYERFNGQWRHIPGSEYHSPADLETDIGAGGERGFVLLSEEFRYFGSETSNPEQPHSVHWQTFPNLRRILDRLTVGERVHHEPEVRAEIEKLVGELFSATRQEDLGQPRHGAECHCDRDDDVIVIVSRASSPPTAKC
jgi:hypothetical protein